MHKNVCVLDGRTDRQTDDGRTCLNVCVGLLLEITWPVFGQVRNGRVGILISHMMLTSTYTLSLWHGAARARLTIVKDG